ncbi:hypothetical protein FOMPIDRAFT_1049746 [Fomitopsis schrenkii]|uniref:DUF6532 domain-containing protein n=1 Tax=Fomitopsis schrenkii TaxID=2126942 RepID=S8FQ42_FOMSC|nr:hypothetical protein FOMPIDRAFT_1049746 [Fomitopsis schrenkii]
MKASKVTSQNVFRHQAISVIIKKQWFGQGQRNFGVNMASEEFRRVPDNIICLVCNAIEVVPRSMVFGSESPFSAKDYASIWEHMTVLEALKDKTPNYYNNTKSLLWDNMGIHNL